MVTPDPECLNSTADEAETQKAPWRAREIPDPEQKDVSVLGIS